MARNREPATPRPRVPWRASPRRLVLQQDPFRLHVLQNGQRLLPASREAALRLVHDPGDFPDQHLVDDLFDGAGGQRPVGDHVHVNPFPCRLERRKQPQAPRGRLREGGRSQGETPGRPDPEDPEALRDALAKIPDRAAAGQVPDRRRNAVGFPRPGLPVRRIGLPQIDLTPGCVTPRVTPCVTERQNSKARAQLERMSR